MPNKLTEKTVKPIGKIKGSDTAVKDSVSGAVNQMPMELVLSQGRSLAVNLQNFVNSAKYALRTRQMKILVDGTSISYGGASWAESFARQVQRELGASRSDCGFFTGGHDGWKAQSFCGKAFRRAKGLASDGAAAITREFFGVTSIGIKYSKNTDGGSCAVTLSKNGATAVAQTAINCNGTWAIGQVWKLETLDPTAYYTLVISPPASGYGYLEEYASIANDLGIVVQNASWGGRGIRHHNGTAIYPTQSGEYATDEYVGDAGMVCTYGDTDALFKADLIIVSGFTNDGNDVTNFPPAVLRMGEIVAGNTSSAIYGIEPINKAAMSYVNTHWQTNRQAIYTAAATYKANFAVLDWDRLVNSDCVYDITLHQEGTVPGGDSTHPLEIAHMVAVRALCQAAGMPYRVGLGRSYGIENAVSYSQSYEPLNAPIGSTWEDTSVSPSLKKKLVSRAPSFGDFHPDNFGVWEVMTGASALLWKAVPAEGGTWVKKWNDVMAIDLVPGTGFTKALGDLAAGTSGTVSFFCEGSGAPIVGFGLYLGGWPRAVADKNKRKFWLAVNGGNNSGAVYSGGAGETYRVTIPFVIPSGAERDALIAAGVSMDNLHLDINAPNSGHLYCWEIRLDSGASMTNSI